MKRLAAIACLLAACGGSVSVAPPSPSPAASPSVEASTVASNPPTAPPTPAPSATPEGPLAGAWRKLEPAGDAPAAREDHTWTVDASTQTAYLFGGRDGATVFGDLFAFDFGSDTWRRLDPEGTRPQARFGHEAQWLNGVGLVVFAGQASATRFFGDLWAFDPTTNRWTQLPAGGDAPVPRYGSCSGVGPDGRLWISHGFTEEGSRFFDTRAYDFEAQAWTDLTPEPPRPVDRCLHACWWTPGGQFALYAGQTTGVPALGDLWMLEPGPASAADAPGAWTQAEGTLPPERALPAVTAVGEDELVFGGRALSGDPLADAYVVDGSSLRMTALTVTGDATPSARFAATLVTDLAHARVLLFGGKGSDGALADTWVLALE